MKCSGRMLASIFCISVLGIFFPESASADPIFDVLNQNGAHVIPPEKCGQMGDHWDAAPAATFEESLARYLAIQSTRSSSERKSSPFQWTPSGRTESIVPPECRGRYFEEQVSAAAPGTSEDLLNGYMDQCLSYVETGWPGPYGSLWRFSSIGYSYCENSRFREIHWTLPDGELRRGFLGLQPELTPRPLIIIICGVYCNAENPASYWQVMKLFDEGPFHVLVLGNTTGTHFVYDNRYVSIGGLIDGNSILNLLDWLESSPLAERISSFHLAGVSLGGHAILAAALYESFRPARKIPVRSYLVQSPVVDIEASFKRLFQEPILSFISRLMFSKNFKSVFESLPELRHVFLPDGQLIAAREIPDKTAEVMLEHIRKHRSPLSAPFDSMTPNDSGEIWTLSRLQDHMHMSRIPGLVLAPTDDPIVNYRQNTGALESVAKQLGPNLMEVIPFIKGGHNGISDYIGWESVAGFYRGFFMQRSPELKEYLQHMRSSLPRKTIPASYKQLPIIKYQWQSMPESNWIELRLTFFDQHRTFLCRTVKDPYSSNSHCHKTTRLRFSMEDLKVDPLYIPATWAEAQALTRWLNAELLLLDSRGKPLERWGNGSILIDWRQYY